MPGQFSMAPVCRSPWKLHSAHCLSAQECLVSSESFFTAAVGAGAVADPGSDAVAEGHLSSHSQVCTNIPGKFLG